MSLITVIELEDSISIISDGQLTKDDEYLAGGFKKYYVGEDYFMAITESQAVARILFEETKKSKLDKYGVEELIKDCYQEIEHEYQIVLGQIFGGKAHYTVFNHFNGVYNSQKVITLTKPMIMHSGNFSDYRIQEFNKKITKMISKGKSKQEIINEQINFHIRISKVDTTVNDEILDEILQK